MATESGGDWGSSYPQEMEGGEAGEQGVSKSHVSDVAARTEKGRRRARGLCPLF